MQQRRQDEVKNSNCVGWDLQWSDRWKQGEAGLARSRKVVEAVAMAGCRGWDESLNCPGAKKSEGVKRGGLEC